MWGGENRSALSPEPQALVAKRSINDGCSNERKEGYGIPIVSPPMTYDITHIQLTNTRLHSPTIILIPTDPCLQSHMFMHTLVHNRLQSHDLTENGYKHNTVLHNDVSLYSLMRHSFQDTIKC